MEPFVERVRGIPSQLAADDPHWDNGDKSLYFVDAIDKTINKYVPSTEQFTSAKLERSTSIIIPYKEENQFVIDAEKDLCIITWDGVSDRVSKEEIIAQQLPYGLDKYTANDLKGPSWNTDRREIFTKVKNDDQRTSDVLVFLGDCILKLNRPKKEEIILPPDEIIFYQDPEPSIVPKIHEMRIDTNISNRFAKTIITSKVQNLHPKAQEATFSIVTPDKAFISGFTMEIDGKKYEAYVKEKEEAKQSYDQAVASGRAAAHVAVSARDSNRFTVSVNLEPKSEAVFYLTYEELLERKQGMYEVVLNIHPGQLVEHLEVRVNIAESRPLKFVKVPSLRSGNEMSKNESDIYPEAVIESVNETSAVVTFKPDIISQKLFGRNLGGEKEKGFSGQFVVQYDVNRDPQGGEVLVDGGYFVHFFAPDELPQLKKQVVFILDTSGSMTGIRIAQLKEAMNSILDELNSEDIFSIVEFNSIIKVWNIPIAKVTYQEGVDQFTHYHTNERSSATVLEQVLSPSVEASEDNIKKAKTVIQQLEATGGTDIQLALNLGLRIVAKNADPKTHQPIVVFLTDGEPTVGECNTRKIISTITELNANKVPIFSLSFGEGADREFLQKLSLKNQGFARHIYEAADANLQLEDFYRQISSPLLSNVTFKYVDNVKNVTRKHFPILFGGGELCIAGMIEDPNFVPPVVEGCGLHGQIKLEPKVCKVAVGSLERLWAYLTVKKLLEQRDVVEDKEEITREALRLALKYSFVTDVSSLVVVKPNDTSAAVDTEDAAKKPGFGGGSLGPSLGRISHQMMMSSPVSFGMQGPTQSMQAAPQYGAMASPMFCQQSVAFGSAGLDSAVTQSMPAARPYGAMASPMFCQQSGAFGSAGFGSPFKQSMPAARPYGAMASPMFCRQSVAFGSPGITSQVKRSMPTGLFGLQADMKQLDVVESADDGTTIIKTSIYDAEFTYSNGLALNKKLLQFYHIDTKEGTIEAIDYDTNIDSLATRIVIFTLAKHNIKGFANGMAIDVDGNLWVAIFGGGCVLQIDGRKPETILQKVEIPTLQVTSVVWGGNDLDILYVTTGNSPVDGQESDSPNNGAVFKVTGLGTRGMASP